MNPEQENIQALRRLLALKRHEQPSPGYFDRFSGQVIARIRAGERAPDSFWERFGFEATWLQQIWAAFETKPLLAGAFGATVCALITMGFVFADGPSNLQSAPLSVLSPNGNRPAIVQVATPVPGSIFGKIPGLDSPSSESVDAVQPSLFQQFEERRPRAQLVNDVRQLGN
jgi:hypothetical protein